MAPKQQKYAMRVPIYATSSIPGTAEVTIRPFKPEDQKVLWDIWLSGFDETLRDMAQKQTLRNKYYVAAVLLGSFGAAAASHFGWLSGGVALCCALTLVFGLMISPHVKFFNMRRELRVSVANGDMSNIQANWVEHSDREFWVAEMEGQAVGGTGLHVGASPHPGPFKSKEPMIFEDNVAYLYRMTVDPGVRRRGVAGKLLVAAEELARAKGCRAVNLATASVPAMEMYTRNGYKRVASTPYTFEKAL
eukprot:CAMPEP_0119114102 /NCGR_PEP_ID=MMETSP1180-20130426/46169_1 /TAXON_ID=3052 ORGANISM="Chlamydomonas cf sp, Strain CCMP681" /NCGR_SAMPLE_ID=MMETSP1180 /ASSEMBLY_ACC=CAM_ASM_000741 /LENGTH=247 /DNA_ID=CAMNT_0007102473 /DNA_START=58 /DNA_END=801 /DNA_ORIENTATION=+